MTVLLENKAMGMELVASHLFKWCQCQQDEEGCVIEFRYFRDIDKRDVNFEVNLLGVYRTQE